jgi:hypothetical protein
MSHDIFISYSSKDKIVADAVVAALEKKDIRCWYAPRDIRPGAEWGDAITHAINDSALMLLVFSKNSNRSKRVLDEIYYAILKEKTILPFRIENLDPRGAMLLHLSSRHWLDAYDPSWEAHINKLVNTAAKTLGKEVVVSDEEIQAPTPAIEPPSKAVHRKRMPWKLTGIILAIAIIITSVIGIIWKSDDIAQAFARTTTTATKTSTDIPTTAAEIVSPTAAATISPTTRVTITPTPTPHPGQVFAEPFIAYIADIPPDFEDDFSTVKPDWIVSVSDGLDIRQSNLTDFVLDGSFVVDGAGTDKEWYGVMLGSPDGTNPLKGNDLIVQFDVLISEMGTDAQINFRFRDDWQSGYNFIVWGDGRWDVSPEGGSDNIASGQAEHFIPGEVNKVLLVAYGNEVVLYLNDQPLIYLQNILTPGEWCVTEFASRSYIHAELDNVKFWNLDGVEWETILFESLPVLEQAQTFAEPILKVIDERQPDFEDDFSTSTQGEWIIFDTPGRNPIDISEFVIEGVLRIDAESTESSYVIGLDNQNIQGMDFVLQFDFTPVMMTGNTHLGNTFRQDRGVGGDYHFAIYGDGEWVVIMEQFSTTSDIISGQTDLNMDKPTLVRLVAFEDQFAIYLNDQPLTYFRDSTHSGDGNSIGMWGEGEHVLVEIDNIMFWNLEGEEFQDTDS